MPDLVVDPVPFGLPDLTVRDMVGVGREINDWFDASSRNPITFFHVDL